MENTRTIIKLLIKVFLVGGGILLVGLLFLVGVYMLPVGRMKSHIAESDGVFNYEGIYPQLMNGIKSSQLDNYTDALMYATAIHPGSDNALQDAMYNARYEYKDTSMTQSLNDYANDVSVKESLRYEIGYSRYWHGYLIILKPILLFLNVSEIRMLNMLMQIVLLILLCNIILKSYGASYTIPIMMMVFVLNPVTLPLSLQFSWVYYISLFGAIILLKMKFPPTNDKYLILFMAIGMLTSYFDLLTYPLITLGLPLALFLLKCREAKPQKRIMLTLLESAFWIGGYTVMWAGKWIFAVSLGHINLFHDISRKISERTSMEVEGGEVLTLWMAVGKPVSVILNKIYLLMILSFFIGCFIWSAYKKQKEKSNRTQENNLKESLLYILPYVFIACMPFVWFCILSNHTYEHYWFAYREMSVTVVATGIAALEYLNKQRKL